MPLEARVVDTLGDSTLPALGRVDPTFALGAVPGDIRGAPRRTLQFIHLNDRPMATMATIDTAALSARIRDGLSRETDDLLISGVSVQPADTRFARVSVGFLKQGSPAKGMFVGFVDAYSYDPMSLFYFDRPCHVTGMTAGDRGTPSPITYDADVKKAGFTWLVAIEQQSGGEIVVVANASTPKMVVAAPTDNLKDGRFQLSESAGP